MSLIFLVGGAFEGKEAYAKAMYPDARVISDYHLKVKKQLQDGKDPMEEVQKLLQSIKKTGAPGKEEKEKCTSAGRQDVVLISDEIGCGVIPLDAGDRKWREYNGRVNCCIASEADQVIRIIAGMPQRLK